MFLPECKCFLFLSDRFRGALTMEIMAGDLKYNSINYK